MPDTTLWEQLFGKRKPAQPVAPPPATPAPNWKLNAVLTQANDAASGEKPKPEEQSILGSIIDKLTGKQSDRVKRLRELQR